MKRFWMALLLIAASSAPAWALGNGLALTPPMGWNSWNRFACNVSESLIRDTADNMVASGMAKAGYRYVIIDDCWQGPRDGHGAITADAKRFPSGIRALADYVHAKGLKFGIYSDAGTNTCQGRSGSHGHERQDAQTYAAWGVDYVKYDWCSTAGIDARTAYGTMSRAIAATGRPMVFSICEWGISHPAKWAGSVGNLWRIAGDITDCFDCGGGKPGAMPAFGPNGPPGGGPPGGGAPGGLPAGAPALGAGFGPPGGGTGKPGSLPPIGAMGLGVLQVIDADADLASAAGPGHWNDPDMLEIGNGGMTQTEDQAHFSLWAVLAAPLIAGNDLKNMSPATRAILTNREVIAVDQDPAGVQGIRVAHSQQADVWSKRLADGSRAVALLNRGKTVRTIAVKWRDLGLGNRPARVRNLWLRQDVGAFIDGYQAQVPPHGVVLIKVSETPR